MSKIKTNELPKHLSSFLPSNLLNELDESSNSSNRNSFKESNVSKYFYYCFLKLAFK